MKDKIFLMYNRLSNRFSEPFGAASEAVAKRMVRRSFEKSGVSFADFDCYCAGEFDLLTGEITIFPRFRVDFCEPDTILDVEKRLEAAHEQST